MSSTFVGQTQSIPATWNNLRHNVIAIEQCKKAWFVDSLLPLHITHQSGLSTLYGLFYQSKSLVLTFLFATSHAKAFTFVRALDF